MKLVIYILILSYFQQALSEVPRGNCFSEIIGDKGLDYLSLQSDDVKLNYVKNVFLSGDLKKAYDHLNQLNISDRNNIQKLSLSAAISFEMSRKDEAVKKLLMIHKLNQLAWPLLELENIQREGKYLSVCREYKLSSSDHLMCAKLLKREGSKSWMNHTNKVISAEKKMVEDPYSHIRLGKSYLLLGKVELAIASFNNVNSSMDSFEQSRRELLAVYAENGDFKGGEKIIIELQSIGGRNPINDLEIVKFYKKFGLHFLALQNLNRAKACLSQRSRSLLMEFGYLSESLGVSVSNELAYQASFSFFKNHYNPTELTKNSSKGEELNLYSFKNRMYKLAVVGDLRDKSAFSMELSLNEKLNESKENDLAISLGYNKKWLFRYYAYSSFFKFSYMPTYSFLEDSFIRSNYKVSHKTLVDSLSSSISLVVSADHGVENILSTNSVSQFSEVNFLLVDKYLEKNLQIALGLNFRYLYNERDLFTKYFLSINLNVYNLLNINFYNELFVFNEYKVSSFLSSVSVVKPLLRKTNLLLSLSHEGSLGEYSFVQKKMSLGFENNSFINTVKVKSKLELTTIIDEGAKGDKTNALMFSVGVPL